MQYVSKVPGMRATSFLWLTCILALSAAIPYPFFRYELLKSFRRNSETCRMCYGDECTTLTQARCDYYVEAEYIMDEEDDGPGEETEVDAMVYDMVEQAALSWSIQDCLPLISEYTDCIKDNICGGCKRCSCSAEGRWRCRQVVRCRPQPGLDLDHQVLDAVIQALGEYDKPTRKKRSFLNESNFRDIQAAGEPTLIKMDDWMYGDKPNIVGLKTILRTRVDNLTEVGTSTGFPSTQTTVHSNAAPELDLNFDEVLKNIAIEGSQYKRRKPQLKDKHYPLDVELEDVQIIKHNDSDQFDVLNAIEGYDVATDSIFSDTTLLVNLLAYSNGNDKKEIINNDTDDIINILNKDMKNSIDNDELNYKIGMGALNLKKRDASSITHLTNSSETTTKTEQTDNDLNNTVLIPLTNIIEEKQNELSDLLQIKENLLNYMNIKNNTDLNSATERVPINGSNTYFSIYKLDLLPEIIPDFRRSYPNTLDQLLYKLKRDIYEVKRDIGAIQRLTNTKDLPDDLKMLIQSMKKFNMQKQHNTPKHKEKDLNAHSQYKNTRRNYQGVEKDSDRIKGQLISIFEVLKKNMPHANVMALLSRDAKKIIKRVINIYYEEESAFNFKLYNSEYNITNDLNTIGNTWLKLTINLENSPPAEKLYALKLLHLTLDRDMNKLADAISLIDFARSRRMILIETPEDTIMDKINNGLDSIRNKVKILINYRNRATRMGMNIPREAKIENNYSDITKRKVKKQSFIKKLKNLLRSSKKDIVDMRNKNIPKSEIVKTIAKKKLDELAQKKVDRFQNTMLRWQSDLKIKRKKRGTKFFRKIQKKLNDCCVPKFLSPHPKNVKKKRNG